MQRGRKQGMWVGKRVPEVDENGVPILYSRYNSIEEVLQSGGSSAAAKKQGKRQVDSSDSEDDGGQAPAKKKSKKEEEEEQQQQQQQHNRAEETKQDKKDKKKKKQQQHQEEPHIDNIETAGDDKDNQQQQKVGNAEEAKQIRSVLGFEGATAKPAKGFAFSFDAQVAAEVEAETEAKLARLHAIDSADKDGYMPRRVFAGGMPYSYTREQIEEYWSWCGEIESLDMLTFPDSGRFRGIAFITFKTQEGYEAALACDGEQVDGQTLKVDRCKAAAAPRRGSNAHVAVSLAPAQVPTPGSKGGNPGGSSSGGGGGGAGSRAAKTPGYNVAYVGNVAFEVTPDELKEVFSDCGVKLVRLHTDQATGRSKGYAHVHFENEEGLDRAMELDGHVLGGRGIRVSYGQPKK